MAYGSTYSKGWQGLLGDSTCGDPVEDVHGPP